MKRYIFQVKLCTRQFKTEINPDTAAEVLLLADRHCLKSLKQVTTKDQCKHFFKHFRKPKTGDNQRSM